METLLGANVGCIYCFHGPWHDKMVVRSPPGYRLFMPSINLGNTHMPYCYNLLESKARKSLPLLKIQNLNERFGVMRKGAARYVHVAWVRNRIIFLIQNSLFR